MLKKNSKNKVNFFPPKAKLTKIREKMLESNYPRANIALPKNASSLEKNKYFLCQKILDYKLTNELPVEDLAQEINLTVPETEDILFARINKFTLDRLVTYADNLFAFQLEVKESKPRKTLTNSLKNKNISIPSHNNSRTKSIHLRKR